MISVKHNFLFVHVPKTGGNSIQVVLKEYSNDEFITTPRQDGFHRFGVTNRTYGTEKHSPLSRYESALDDATFCGMYKFSVIRNPWDRVVSTYFSSHRKNLEWDRARFVSLVRKIGTLRYYICIRRDRGDSHKGALDKDIDCLVRFEHLESDFRKVCRRLDIPEPESFPVRNKSERDHYSTYYDRELREMVRAKFSDEIIWGGYEFD